MGQPDTTRVDVAALLGIADRYDSAAETIDSVFRSRLSRLTFDGASAGRAHTADGDALHIALAEVADQLRQWSRAATEIAAAVRASAARYADSDVRASMRVG
jgi:uncharacterized protein YukE